MLGQHGQFIDKTGRHGDQTKIAVSAWLAEDFSVGTYTMRQIEERVGYPPAWCNQVITFLPTLEGRNSRSFESFLPQFLHDAEGMSSSERIYCRKVGPQTLRVLWGLRHFDNIWCNQVITFAVAP